MLLPTSLDVNGQSYRIRTDFRDILNILAAFEDPELQPEEKMFVCLRVLYEDCETIPEEDMGAAYTAAIQFIDAGMDSEGGSGPKTMDWEQDAPILFPAVNHVAGYETRSVEYLHWWTFVGFFMEIRESVYSTVLHVRAKKAKGKKMEKWEKDFWNANKKLCTLQTKLTAEEKAEKDRLNAMLN